MERTPNARALAVVRQILDAAHPLEIDVEGMKVVVTPERGPQAAWPRPLRGLDPTSDGPWPPYVRLHCRWSAGAATMRLHADFWSPGAVPYGDMVALRVGAKDSQQEVLWMTIANALGTAPFCVG